MSKAVKYSISDNINLYVIYDTKYKTTSACAYLHRHLSRDEVTYNSLISKVLKTSTKKYKTMSELNIYSETLYGCVYDVSIAKRANIQSIVSSVNVISDKFTGESCEEKAFELMLDLLFKPNANDGGFCEDYVKSQKNNLRDDIEGLINDKRAYANVRCIEEMCAGEPNAVVEIGYSEDIDAINAYNLYEHYKSIIYTSPIDVFVVGDVDANKILEYFKGYFSQFTFNISPISISYSSKLPKEVKYVEDNLDVNQGKLAIGLRTNVNIDSPLYYALLTGNSIFGSGAHSKLFNNVREKMSLCYYAYSRLDKYNSLMLIGSGIEFANFEKTKNAVLEELKNVQIGIFTDEELEISKEFIINSYKSYEDSPGFLVDYYMGVAFSPSLPSLEEACQRVKDVTKEQVIQAFADVVLDTVYFLNGKEGNQ